MVSSATRSSPGPSTTSSNVQVQEWLNNQLIFQLALLIISQEAFFSSNPELGDTVLPQTVVFRECAETLAWSDSTKIPNCSNFGFLKTSSCYCWLNVGAPLDRLRGFFSKTSLGVLYFLFVTRHQLPNAIDSRSVEVVRWFFSVLSSFWTLSGVQVFWEFNFHRKRVACYQQEENQWYRSILERTDLYFGVLWEDSWYRCFACLLRNEERSDAREDRLVHASFIHFRHSTCFLQC
jgi:hypothetical protein